jgi:hypothetical protein
MGQDWLRFPYVSVPVVGLTVVWIEQAASVWGPVLFEMAQRCVLTVDTRTQVFHENGQTLSRRGCS